MKTIAKTKMYSLIAAIVIFILVVSFVVPITLAYFSKTQSFGADSDIPSIECYIEEEGFKADAVTVDNTQMFISNSVLSGVEDLGVSATAKINSNIPVILRVKITFKMSSSSSPSEMSQLSSITSNFIMNVDSSNWILGTNTSGKIVNGANTKASDVTSYYLYYKGVVGAGNNREIQIFNEFKQVQDLYSGKYVVAEFYSEALQANETGAKKWVSEGNLSGWEATWYSSVTGDSNFVK